MFDLILARAFKNWLNSNAKKDRVGEFFDVISLCRLWTDGGLQLESNLLENLIEDVLHKDDVVHSSASAALAHFVHDFSDLVNPALTRLTEAYGEKRKVKKSKVM